MAGSGTRVRSAALWTLVGLAFLVSIAGILSIGLFTLPLAAAGAVVVGTRPGRTRGLAIMLSGAAVGPLLVAWLNREGPGRVCHNDPPYGLLCGDRLNPWPFLAASAVALLVAAALFVRAARADSAEGVPT